MSILILTSECSLVEPWDGEKACGLKPIVCDDGI